MTLHHISSNDFRNVSIKKFLRNINFLDFYRNHYHENLSSYSVKVWVWFYEWTFGLKSFISEITKDLLYQASSVTDSSGRKKNKSTFLSSTPVVHLNHVTKKLVSGNLWRIATRIISLNTNAHNSEEAPCWNHVSILI